jgi:hypothetical protein
LKRILENLEKFFDAKLSPYSLKSLPTPCTVRVTDFCCDEFVDDCGTTKPLSEQHVSMMAGKLKAR